MPIYFNPKPIPSPEEIAAKAKARGEELYDGLIGGPDIYDVEKGLYVFEYNNDGAIAYYRLSIDEMIALAHKADKEDYIGSCLGPGGYIIDDINDAKEFLSQFSDNVISAMPNDILAYEQLLAQGR